MPLKSWKAKYYPTSADDEINVVSELAAAKHCHKKWTGLKREILKDYDMTQMPGHNRQFLICTSEFNKFNVNSKTCALCEFHSLSDDGHELASPNCQNCILYREGYYCESSNSPYNTWLETGKARPMIEALRHCINKLAKESK